MPIVATRLAIAVVGMARPGLRTAVLVNATFLGATAAAVVVRDRERPDR